MPLLAAIGTLELVRVVTKHDYPNYTNKECLKEVLNLETFE